MIFSSFINPRRSLWAAAIAFTAISAPIAAQEPGHSNEDLVSLINTAAFWRGPTVSDGGFYRWQDGVFTASLQGTVMTVTESFRQGVKQNARTGKICTHAGVFRTTWVFDTRDMQPAVTIQSNWMGNKQELVTFQTRDSLKLIKLSTNADAPECPAVPWSAWIPTSTMVATFAIKVGEPDVARKLQAIAVSAWRR